MAGLFFLSLDACATAAAARDVPTFVRDLRDLSDVERGEVADMVSLLPLYVEAGDVVKVMVPPSECAVHMRIAGTVRRFRVCEHGVRLLNADGTDGVHMTDGEAGVYVDCDGRYCYAC